MVATRRIAHFNVARLQHPPGDPRVAGFVDNIARVNEIAERSAGFVWRLSDESASVAVEGYRGSTGDPCVIYSLSVWESLGALEAFVHKTVHGAFLRKRQDWFVPWGGPNYVIWNFDGSTPVPVEEGWRRLDDLAKHGASENAYDFASVRKHQ